MLRVSQASRTKHNLKFIKRRVERGCRIDFIEFLGERKRGTNLQLPTCCLWEFISNYHTDHSCNPYLTATPTLALPLPCAIRAMTRTLFTLVAAGSLAGRMFFFLFFLFFTISWFVLVECYRFSVDGLGRR